MPSNEDIMEVLDRLMTKIGEVDRQRIKDKKYSHKKRLQLEDRIVAIETRVVTLEEE